MASGAGVNQVRAVLLDNVTTAVTAIATPLAGYGTIGYNDSGWQMTEAAGYTKWTIQLVPLSSTTLVGYAFSVYATISPNAYATFEGVQRGITPYPVIQVGTYPGQPAGKQHVLIPQAQAQFGYGNAALGFFPGIQPWECVLAPGPSEQGSTGPTANPITPSAPITQISGAFDAVRVVLTTIGSAGACRVVCKAVP